MLFHPHDPRSRTDSYLFSWLLQKGRYFRVGRYFCKDRYFWGSIGRENINVTFGSHYFREGGRGVTFGILLIFSRDGKGIKAESPYWGRPCALPTAGWVFTVKTQFSAFLPLSAPSWIGAPSNAFSLIRAPTPLLSTASREISLAIHVGLERLKVVQQAIHATRILWSQVNWTFTYICDCYSFCYFSFF